MDFPVEATVCLERFPDESQVLRLLRSHGFEVKDLAGGEVRVKGSYLDLRTVKAHLEQIIQTTTSSSSNVPAVFPGAVSKYYSDEGRATSPPSYPSYASGSSHRRPASQDYGASSPPDLQEPIVVDADVFRYASQLRTKDLNNICHNVEIKMKEFGDSTSITLQGRSSRTAVYKLQSLLEDLNKSLRTQEVPLRDLSPQGLVLLQGIKKTSNVSGLVLVQEMDDRLHLIGPSKDSYELKQSLLGRQVDQSKSRGRSVSKTSRGRSSSLPPTNRRSSGRDASAGGGAASAGGGAASAGGSTESAGGGAASAGGGTASAGGGAASAGAASAGGGAASAGGGAAFAGSGAASAGGAAGFQQSKDETQVGGSYSRRRSFSEFEGKKQTQTPSKKFKQKVASFFKTPNKVFSRFKKQ